MRNEPKRLTLLVLIAGASVIYGAESGGPRKSIPPETVLYVWAGDQARVAADFLAVIDFDERSENYGRVLKTVPLPPPGNIGNEPHHCNLNRDETILACGGLLSVLKGQNGIFFWDVTDKYNPKFIMSAKAAESSITDDFFPTSEGGFLITQMGAANGSSPGRVAEFDRAMHFVANHFGTTSLFLEWPSRPPLDGFNPHGISARPEMNLMMTSDFVEPSSTLNAVAGDPVLRGTVRIWDYAARKITKTVELENPAGGHALGAMDVKMLPGDPNGIGYATGMFDGHLYMIDPKAETAKAAFDFTTLTPRVPSDVIGGMTQLLAAPQSGDRLIFGLFQAGQVGMLDTTDREHLKQVALLSFGANTGPHNLMLSHNDSRLVVTDYFLNEDDFGKVHAEGDHKVRVIKVTHDTLIEDKRFSLDFDTAFTTGPARPHGIAMK